MDLPAHSVEYIRALLRSIWGVATLSRTPAPPARRAPAPPARRAPVAPARREVQGGHAGILAAILVHGAATQGRCLEYMRDHRHILPYLAATYSKHDGGDVQLDYTRSTLWTNITAEPPPPSLPGCGPVFFGPPSFQENYNRHWSVDLLSAVQDPAWPISRSSPYRCEPGIKPLRSLSSVDDRFPVGWIAGNNGVLYRMIAPLCDGTSSTVPAPTVDIAVCPAASVKAWALQFADRARGDRLGLERAGEVLAPFLKKTVRVPDYWNESEARRDRWWVRLVRWYHRAGWLVWAGEMMWLHIKGAPVPAPKFWADHCAGWGVGVPSWLDVATKGTAKRSAKSSQLLTVDEGVEDMIAILEWIVSVTPLPGSPGTLGDQIVDGSRSGGVARKRHILDMPAAAGSIDLPYALDDWGAYALQRWGAHEAGQEARGFNIFAAVISIEASLCGAGFGSAVTAPIAQAAAMYGGAAAGGLVSRVVSLAVQNAFRAGRTGDLGDLGNWGDVVGLIGEAVDLAGVELGDAASLLPAGTWEALQSAGASFPAVAGADNDALQAPLERIRSTFADLRSDGWPYISEAYGGMGLASGAVDVAGAVRLF